MTSTRRSRLVALILIAVIGISGVIEALPHASESAGDLLFDAAIVAGVVVISFVLARFFRRRAAPTE